MHILSMTPRKLHAQSLYLSPEKAALLDELARETRIPKAVLLREAIDDLLAKHGVALVEHPSEPSTNVVRFKTRNMQQADEIFDALAREAGCENFAQLKQRVQFMKDLAATKRKKKTSRTRKKLK
jgi:hypothetical protein